MTVITLTVTDHSLEEGTYRVDFHAEGSQIDEGRATAAYFTGFYLHTLINTPDFLAGASECGKQLFAAGAEAGVMHYGTEKAKAILTITDVDTDTGQMSFSLEGEGGDLSGKTLPTPAQIIGVYMRSLLSDMNFQVACWAFAEEFIASHGAEITNRDSKPAANDIDTGGASRAA
jgi:hypothetical protein